jgi:hypothetical protein
MLEIIQFIPFQKNLLQKAASAVFTYLVTNPDNMVMQENLKFYSDLPEVDMNQVVNFEAQVRSKCQCYPHMIMISVIIITKDNLNYSPCIS